MENTAEEEYVGGLLAGLKADCQNCRGICCSALCFAEADGFPSDKAAGEPCAYLAPGFRCGIHPELRGRGLRGCADYDCLGAGQKAAMAVSADAGPELLHRVFAAVFQLNQMLWYLCEAYALECAAALRGEIFALIEENLRLSGLPPDGLLRADIGEYKVRADAALKKAAALARGAFGCGSAARRARDFVGKDFRGTDLRGRDFSMSLLIAADMRGCSLCGANLLGADLRDADISGADLSRCVFLTQMQINTAKGSAETKLPPALARPPHWNGM